MIALDPILLEFYQGNVLTFSLLLSMLGGILKLLAVMSKNNEGNKVLSFLIGAVEGAKSRIRKRNGGKNERKSRD